MNGQNLIYVFADQLGLRHCGYAGEKKARTPNIDRLAGESVNLVNAVSGHPVCAPYRASLFTGKYTTSTRMVINEIRMGTGHECFAHVLGAHDYNTGYIGKWHLYADELGNHFDPKNSFIPPGPDRLGFGDNSGPGVFAAYNFHHDFYGERAYYHLDTPDKIFADKYEPDFQTDLAIKKLGELAVSEKPFALFLSLGTPHDPWTRDNVPPEYMAQFEHVQFDLPPNYKPENDAHADGWARLSERERGELTEWMRVYYAMTANLDYNIGRISAAIDELGLRENSILVFTSDHGEMFGAQGRRAKNIFYEEAVRVPFLVRLPGGRAGECDACFNTVDIMPTLLPLMGLPVPSEAEGSDMSRLLLTGGGPEPEGALMMCTGKTAEFGDGYEWRAVRTKRYTYAVYRIDGEEHLYDNLADPYQLNNLADSRRDLRGELRALMLGMMGKIGDSFEATSYYERNWVKDRRII